jgi:hypothetical protein
MKQLSIHRRVARFAAVLVALGLSAGIGRPQDPAETPQYKTETLKSGFDPDPVVIKVDAGGPIKTNLGGFDHFVAKKPDVRLNFTAGKYVLTIYADCDADATLLIRLPNGEWVGNDNGPGAGKNPVLRFPTPQTGTYNIWIGAIDGSKTPPARLFITELKK